MRAIDGASRPELVAPLLGPRRSRGWPISAKVLAAFAATTGLIIAGAPGQAATEPVAATVSAKEPLRKEPLRVLFIGNSFTYGPSPYDRPDPAQLNNLPRMFKLVAESMGERVLVAEDTIGGCTLWMHRPSLNPEGCTDGLVCQPVANARVNGSDACTVSAAIPPDTLTDAYSPCPQLLTRQPYGPWDVVVVQDQSSLPFVQEARRQMLLPAVQEIAAAHKRQGARVPRARAPLLASYMTWAYYNGTMATCPGMLRPGCFPFGSLDELSECALTDALYRKTSAVPCQAYALARGYAETLEHGADVLVPAGLALLAARGAPPIPRACRRAIDAEYADAGPLRHLALPLAAADASDARWGDELSALELFNDLGAHCDSNPHPHDDSSPSPAPDPTYNPKQAPTTTRRSATTAATWTTTRRRSRSTSTRWSSSQPSSAARPSAPRSPTARRPSTAPSSPRSSTAGRGATARRSSASLATPGRRLDRAVVVVPRPWLAALPAGAASPGLLSALQSSHHATGHAPSGSDAASDARQSRVQPSPRRSCCRTSTRGGGGTRRGTPPRRCRPSTCPSRRGARTPVATSNVRSYILVLALM